MKRQDYFQQQNTIDKAFEIYPAPRQYFCRAFINDWPETLLCNKDFNTQQYLNETLNIVLVESRALEIIWMKEKYPKKACLLNQYSHCYIKMYTLEYYIYAGQKLTINLLIKARLQIFKHELRSNSEPTENCITSQICQRKCSMNNEVHVYLGIFWDCIRQ